MQKKESNIDQQKSFILDYQNQESMFIKKD